MFTLKRALLSFAIVVAATLGSAGAAAASGAAAPYCGITWGSLPKALDAAGSAPLLDARTGQHDCYDRVVFEVQGSPAGYRVGYEDTVFSDAKGDPLSIAGGARLGVHLLADSSAYPFKTGDHVAGLGGYRTLRDVVYGGGFEGHTTFGVGTRARLPFRVFTLAGPGGHTRVVVDVSHRW